VKGSARTIRRVDRSVLGAPLARTEQLLTAP
jgi:hypothetical protein